MPDLRPLIACLPAAMCGALDAVARGQAAERAALQAKLSVLQVRDFLSGEFTPLPLADVMAALKAREAAGSVRLVLR